VSTDRTRDRLIDAAERLFAEHGFDGVTMKQITAEAGQRNASALQYHFGSKIDLVRAIVARRMPSLNEHRNRLLDDVESAGAAGDLRAVVAALIRPLADLLEREADGHLWVRFLEQAWSNPRSGLGDAVRNEFNTGVVRGGLMLAALMKDLPDEVVQLRLSLLPGQVLHSFADHLRVARVSRGPAAKPSGFFLEGLIDMVVAELSAPVSAETRSALEARTALAPTGVRDSISS
jgi:AcrR family transcriptional regulator